MRLLSTVLFASLASAASLPYGRRQASSGCGRTAPIRDSGDADERTANGRLYHVYVPNSYNPGRPTPLILSYHGLGGNWSANAEEAMLHEERFNTGQIVVYMQGLDNADGLATWEGAPGATNDDIGFTNNVLDIMESKYCIDTKRIYATGMSQGGGFVGQLACHPVTSTRIAAFAPVCGAFYVTAVDKEAECHPETLAIPCSAGRTNIPIMELHGGSDDTINYNGDFRKGACLPSIMHWTEAWARRNGASTVASTRSLDWTVDGEVYRYDGLRVRHVYAGDDVGHVWMSKEKGNADIEATNWVIPFFNEYTL